MLLAKEDFLFVTAEHTGDNYLPKVVLVLMLRCCDTPGVSIVGNNSDTYDSERLVCFNANTMSGSYAPHVLTPLPLL